MNRLAIVLFVVTCLGSATALWMSLWPGLLSEVVLIAFLLGIVPVGLLFLTALVAVPIGLWRGWRPAPLKPLGARLLIAIPIVAVVALAALITALPCRIAFRCSISAFEATVQAQESTAPVDAVDGYKVAENRRVGFYHVDEYGVDPRGGIYFRISTGPDGIGPDQTSYGFVKKPNAEGTRSARPTIASNI